MSSQAQGQEKPSSAVRAQAAAWVARLHGPNRTEDVETGLRRWLTESPEHATAFELVTDTWEKSSRLRRRPMERVATWEKVGFRMSFSGAAFAAIGVAALAIVGTFWYLRSDAVVTRIGEQRTLTLEDASRVYLNTDTRVRVHFDKQLRQVELEKGEALFDVAKHPGWPFVVTAGDRRVRAVGTSFVVRRDAKNLAVTLVEGKVTVAPMHSVPQGRMTQSAAPPAPGLDNQSQFLQAGAESVFTLSPGQRLLFAPSKPPKVDRPSLERVVAWQRGQVAFDNTPLVEAVAEMNRYSTVRLVVEDPAAAAIRLSGIFRAGDSANFAQAVARTYQLQVREVASEIVLAGQGTAHSTP